MTARTRINPCTSEQIEAATEVRTIFGWFTKLRAYPWSESVTIVGDFQDVHVPYAYILETR